MSGVPTEDEPGQITAAVGRACLRFKSLSEVEGQKMFVKCSFPGRGTSILLSGTGDSDERTAASAAVVAPSDTTLVPPLTQSAPVDIVIVSSHPEKESEVPGGDVEHAGTEAPQNDADAKEMEEKKGSVTLVELGFSLDSAKFALTEENLSLLENTEMQIELCSHGVDGAETVIGTATARIANVLRGQNEWRNNLPLGIYSHIEQTASDTKNNEGETADAVNESNVEGGAEGQDEGVIQDKQATPVDTSLGPLEFGGSTSTVCVTLLTDDGTSDYTVGGGSLWTDGAEISGVPEGWKVQPPPETERSGWNDAIAQILAGN